MRKKLCTAIVFCLYTFTSYSEVMYKPLLKQLLKEKRYNEMPAIIEQAIEQYTPHKLQELFNLVNTCIMIGYTDCAMRICKQLFAQNPHSLNICYNCGYTAKMAGKPFEAIKYYEYVLSKNPKHPQAEFGLSLSYFAAEQFEQSWDHYYKHLDAINRPYQELKQLYKNKQLTGKKIVLLQEGGLGDTIHFIRYAKILKDCGAHITAMPFKQLVPLLSLCDYIDVIIPSKTDIPPHHAMASLMNLPAILRINKQTMASEIPYLKANPTLVEKWKHLFSKETFNIGICWQVNKHNEVSRYPVARRGIALKTLEAILGIPNVQVYSLQQIDGIEEIRTLANPELLHTFDETFDKKHGPFMDTAAVMMHLDLIISVDTATAHLAGALGKPVWLLLPYGNDWRWIPNRTDSPWYPTMKIFKQPKAFDWETVIQNVITSLTQLISEQKPNLQQLLKTAQDNLEHGNIQQAIAKLTNGLSTTQHNKQEQYKFANNMMLIGLSLHNAGKLHEAAALFTLLTNYFPNSWQAHYNLGLSAIEVNKIDTACNAYKRALQLQPNNPHIQHAYAMTLLASGDFTNGWKQHEARWQLPTQNKKQLPFSFWNGQNLTNKTILLMSEGALGDVFQFVRFAQLIKQRGAKVYLKTFTALHPLLYLCPYIDGVICSDTQVPTQIDYCTSLMSLPFIFGTTIDTIPNKPYLLVNKQLKTYWKNQLNPKTFNVGICWNTNNNNDGQRHQKAKRSILLQEFSTLFDIPNTTFYSLQHIDGLEQIKNVPKLQIFKNIDTDNGRFMDTAAIIANLDLVITVDTSIAHLAGGLGVQTFTLLPYKADWRWMIEQSDTPWYPTMKLFRKTEHGPWSDVIKKVTDEITCITK